MATDREIPAPKGLLQIALPSLQLKGYLVFFLLPAALLRFKYQLHLDFLSDLAVLSFSRRQETRIIGISQPEERDKRDEEPSDLHRRIITQY